MLVPGLTGTKELVVHRHHLASLTGNYGASVLSTHHVVLLMELAARDAVKNRLPEGSITVGTAIRIDHFSGAVLGARVRAEGVLRRIEGRRLFFDVVAYDEYEKISEGENQQTIINLDTFVNKMIRKQRRLQRERSEAAGTE